MAKNITISDNYIVFDDEGVNGFEVFPFSSIYTEDANSFVIRAEPRAKIREIQFSNVGEWCEDQAGTTPYTEESLRTFLQTNTGL